MQTSVCHLCKQQTCKNTYYNYVRGTCCTILLTKKVYSTKANSCRSSRHCRNGHTINHKINMVQNFRIHLQILLGVRIRSVCISMTFEPTPVDYCQQVWYVLLGRSVMHVQQSVKSVRRAKRTYYVERVRECERVFEPHRTRGYGCFSRRPRVLFASLGAGALSCTRHS